MTYDFSKTMQARREWSEIFKVLREIKNLNLCTLQNYASRLKEKYELSKTKIERIPYQQTCFAGNVKRSSLERMKIRAVRS